MKNIIVMAVLWATVLLTACADSIVDTASTGDNEVSEIDPLPVDAEAAIALAEIALALDKIDAIAISGSAHNVMFAQTRSMSGPYEGGGNGPHSGLGTDISQYVQTISLDSAEPRSFATGWWFGENRFGFPQPHRYNLDATMKSNWNRQLELWLTPWGFLKGAAANDASASLEVIDGELVKVVRWSPATPLAPSGVQYKVEGHIDPDSNLITQIQTWVDEPLAGDLNVQQRFEGWRVLDGVMVPSAIRQLRMGWEFFRVTVTDVTVNPDDLDERFAAAPEGGAGFAGLMNSQGQGFEDLAPRVYKAKGSYTSLVVEFDDYVAIFGAGPSLNRGRNLISQTRELIPGKDIRYLINDHAHLDHSRSLAPFVAEGITILTHENNVEFLTKALSTPRTLLGDALAKSGAKPRIEGVGDLRVLEDASGMRLELHHIKDNPHTDGMLVAYMPRERIVYQADLTLPAAGRIANSSIVAFADNVKRLGLEFDRFIAVHNFAQPNGPDSYEDVMEAVSRKQDTMEAIKTGGALPPASEREQSQRGQ